MSGVRACIVDLDGTLVDTLGDFDAALAGMLAALGLPPAPREHIARWVGKGSENLIHQALTHARQAHGAAASEVTAADVRAAWPLYQQAYLRVNGQHSRVYEGAADGLRALQAAGLPLACLTNKPLAFARPLLAAKGLDGFFSHVFGGDSFARKKPDPLPLVETCKVLGTAPAHTLMVGDSSNDARAARAAGCPLALVRYGYNHGEPVEQVGADVLLNALTELPGWLARHDK
ncbi:MAG: phosphoglycolate phosphatase [Pseudomonadota bacterium]|nr:phosphoglycolate phosphatase [Pseudomonadota bacterium]